MFREENRIWFYLIGLVIVMALVLYVGITYVFPWIRGEWNPGNISFLFQEPPAFSLDTQKDYRARVYTNAGVFTLDLLEDAAPQNVNNFVFLVNANYYNGTSFHRLVPGLLLQGGDRNTLDTNLGNDGFGNPGYFINDEVNWDALRLSEARRNALRAAGYVSTPSLPSVALSRLRVAVANNGPNTNGSQFFIVLANQGDQRLQAMQGQFTVFATVVDGADTVNKMAATPVDNPSSNAPRPRAEIVIDRIEVFTL